MDWEDLKKPEEEPQVIEQQQQQQIVTEEEEIVEEDGFLLLGQQKEETTTPTGQFINEQIQQSLHEPEIRDSELLNREQPEVQEDGFIKNSFDALGAGALRNIGGFIGSLEMLPAMMYDTVATTIQNPIADLLGIEDMKVNYKEDFRDKALNPFDTFGDTGYLIKETGNRLSPLLEMDKTFEENLSNKNYEEAAEQVWYMINENLPQIGIQILIAATGGAAAPLGLSFIGASKAGGEWLDMMKNEEDGMTTQEEYLNATAKGASEYVANALFSQPYFNSIFNNAAKAGLVTALRKKFFTKSGKIVLSTALNVMEENSVDAMDTFIDRNTKHYDTELSKPDYFENWKSTTAVAAAFGLGGGALDIAVNRPSTTQMKAQKVMKQVAQAQDITEDVRTQVDQKIDEKIFKKKEELDNKKVVEDKQTASTEEIEIIEDKIDDLMFELEDAETEIEKQDIQNQIKLLEEELNKIVSSKEETGTTEEQAVITDTKEEVIEETETPIENKEEETEVVEEEVSLDKNSEAYQELSKIAKESLTPENFMEKIFIEEEVDFEIIDSLFIESAQDARTFFNEATNNGTELSIADTKPTIDDQINEFQKRLEDVTDKRTKEARELKAKVSELENLKAVNDLNEEQVSQRLKELQSQMNEVDLRTKEGRQLKKEFSALESIRYKYERDSLFNEYIEQQRLNFFEARKAIRTDSEAYVKHLTENGVTVTEDMKTEITSALTPKEGYAMNLHRLSDIEPKVRSLINEIANQTKDVDPKTFEDVEAEVRRALAGEDQQEVARKVSKLTEQVEVEAARASQHQKLARFAREVIVANGKIITEMAELIHKGAGTISEVEYAMFAHRVALQQNLTGSLQRLVGNAAKTLSLQRAMVNGEMLDMHTLTPQQFADSPDAKAKTRDIIDAFGGQKSIKDLAKTLADKKGASIMDINEAVNEVSKYSRVLDALIEYRSSNVLMNASTHMTNIISQTGRMLLDDFINFISAGYNSVLGYEEAMTFAKAKAQLIGDVEGIINAFKNPIVPMKQAGETVLGKAPSTFDLVMLAMKDPMKFEQIREATNLSNDRASLEGINQHAVSSERLLSEEFRKGSFGKFIGMAIDYYGAISRNIAFGGLQAGDAPFSSAGYYHALAGELYDLNQNLPDTVKGIPKAEYLKNLKDKTIALRKLRILDPFIQRDILIQEGLETGKTRTQIESEVIEKYIGDSLRAVKPDEMVKIADIDQKALQHSKEVTWKDEFAEGTLGRSIEKFAHAHKEVKLIQMFIHTPAKIFAYAIRNTPLSPATFKDLQGRNGKAAQIKSLGAVTSTIMIMGAGLALYSTNNLTPTARDYKERERMYQAGVVPNSFRIGDSWYSFNRIEPLSYYLSMAANGARSAHEAWSEPEEDSTFPERLASTVGQTLGSMMSTMLDKNYFKGIQDVVAMFQGDGNKYMVNNLVASFTPLYTLKRNLYDYALGGVNPFYDEHLRTDSGLVRRDIFGKPIAHYKSPTGLNPTPMTESSIRQEVYDLGINLSGFGKTIGGVRLTEAQQNELRRYFDEELKAEERMNNFIKSSSYKNLRSASEKKDAINSLWLKLKARARKSLFKQDDYLKEYKENLQNPKRQEGYYEDMFRDKGTGTQGKPKVNIVQQIEMFKETGGE